MEEARLSSEDVELVQVAVPRRHLAAVYEYLGKLMTPPPAPVRALRGDTTRAAGPPDDVACQYCGEDALWVTDPAIYQCTRCALVFRAQIAVDGDNGAWTKRMIDELRAGLQSEVAREVLDTVAKRAPQTVSYDDLLEVTGLEPHRLRAELGALSKTTRRLFGRRTWPMTAKQGWGGGDRMGYRMPAEVAVWWLEAG